MFHYIRPAIVAASMLFAASVAQATEAAFLQSLDGNWSGKGTVRVRTNSSPINVACKFVRTPPKRRSRWTAIAVG